MTLPTGWISVAIGEIAIIVTGRTPPTINSDHHIGAYSFYKPGDLDVADGELAGASATLSSEGMENAVSLPPGSLLVSCIGTLGKVGITLEVAACNQQINAVLPTPAALTKFLYYWSKTIRTWLEEHSSATTIAIINKSRFSQTPVDLPPLAEQHRIVAKLDTLTARLNRARTELDRVTAMAERVRSAVLLSSFAPSRVAVWKAVKLVDVTHEALIGLVRSKGVQSGTGIPYIRMNHFDLQGAWNTHALTYVECSPHEVRRYELKPGDVLFNTRNSTELVGKVAIWPADRSIHVYNNNLLRIRFNDKVLPQFAVRYLMSPTFRAIMEPLKSATTSVAAVYQKALFETPFPVPPIAEQQSVVSLVETAFAHADRLEAEAARARALLDRIEAAILARAFRGELVSQDPDDEPAAALLDRIRAERAATPTAKRGRRVKEAA